MFGFVISFFSFNKREKGTCYISVLIRKMLCTRVKNYLYYNVKLPFTYDIILQILQKCIFFLYKLICMFVEVPTLKSLNKREMYRRE